MINPRPRSCNCEAAPLVGLDPESEHYKAVYAEYGLAMYTAQVLEHGIVNALLCLDLLPNRGTAEKTREQWHAEFDAFTGRHYQATLGNLIKALRTVTTVAPELEELLQRALNTRNFLAHGYFRVRNDLFFTHDGRESCIRELQQAEELFQSADTLLDSTTKPIREKYGLTDEAIEAVTDRAMKDLRGE